MCAVVWSGSVLSVAFCALRGVVTPVASVTIVEPPESASMPSMSSISGLVRLMVFVPALLVTAAVAAVAQQPARFEDVVRNLRNPDPKIRISAVRLLRETGYAEAIAPLAAVVNDQVNDIQLEAIDAELSFFLVEPVSTKKHVALVVEVRTDGRAPAAFELGPLAVWPKAVPAELVDALLQAVDDDNKKVRIEAIYTLGVIGSGSQLKLSDAAVAQLLKALDHYDAGRPRRRRARCRAAAGQVSRRRAAQGGQRFERGRPLRVDPRARRDPRRARDSGADRAAELLRTRRGRLVRARRAGPDRAPVERADLQGAPGGQGSRASAARPSRVWRARGTPRRSSRSSTASTRTNRTMVRAAMAFALYKQGHVTYLARLIDFADDDRAGPAAAGIFPRARTIGHRPRSSSACRSLTPTSGATW